MGWASGSYMSIELWDKIRDYVKPDKQHYVAKTILKIFRDEDADDYCGDSQLEKDAKKPKAAPKPYSLQQS